MVDMEEGVGGSITPVYALGKERMVIITMARVVG